MKFHTKKACTHGYFNFKGIFPICMSNIYLNVFIAQNIGLIKNVPLATHRLHIYITFQSDFNFQISKFTFCLKGFIYLKTRQR